MHLLVEFDGGSRGNPGPAGSGMVVRDEGKQALPIAVAGRFIGTATNNVAEYRGLIMGLERVADLGATSVTVRGDSELVIKQMRGEYRVRNANLRPLYEEAMRLVSRIGQVVFEHNLRDANRVADRLANLAMDRRGHVDELPQG